MASHGFIDDDEDSSIFIVEGKDITLNSPTAVFLYESHGQKSFMTVNFPYACQSCCQWPLVSIVLRHLPVSLEVRLYSNALYFTTAFTLSPEDEHLYQVIYLRRLNLKDINVGSWLNVER